MIGTSAVADVLVNFSIWLADILKDNDTIMFLNDDFVAGSGRKEVRQ